jgi:hypothetical protein
MPQSMRGKLTSGRKEFMPHCGLPWPLRQIESVYGVIQSVNEAQGRGSGPPGAQPGIF